MPNVYILRSEGTRRIYIGSTRRDDVQSRLLEHNAGKTRSTKPYRPWTIVYMEKYDNYSEARKRENFLKTGQGRRLIKEELLKT